jgi:hypothetical protein
VRPRTSGGGGEFRNCAGRAVDGVVSSLQNRVGKRRFPLALGMSCMDRALGLRRLALPLPKAALEEPRAMTRRPSDTFRDKLEAAQRAADPHGTVRSVHELRAEVVLALRGVRGNLDRIDRAAEQNDVAWLQGSYRGWKAEQRYLREEARQLEELRADVDAFLLALA